MSLVTSLFSRMAETQSGQSVLTQVREDVQAAGRRKRLLIAGGVVAGLLALIGGGWYWYHTSQKKKGADRKSNPTVRLKSKRSKGKARVAKAKARSRKARKTKASKKLKDTTEIQTLIFSKDRFETAADAKSWAKEHDFKVTKVDETGQSFRLRQHVPGLYGRRSFRTITLTDGVKGVVARRKEAA